MQSTKLKVTVILVHSRVTFKYREHLITENHLSESGNHLNLQCAIHSSNVILLHTIWPSSMLRRSYRLNLQAHVCTVEQVCISVLPAGDYLCSLCTIWLLEVLCVCLSLSMCLYSVCAFCEREKGEEGDITGYHGKRPYLLSGWWWITCNYC